MPPAWSEADREFMGRALELAHQAGAAGEVPVGAVLTQEDRIVGEGRNRPLDTSDPTAHAEIEALRSAALRIRNYRLPQSTLYVTLEPCTMCAGALTQARVSRLVFAARDLRFGAVRSKFQLADSPLLNHQVAVDEGLFALEAVQLLTDFFKHRR